MLETYKLIDRRTGKPFLVEVKLLEHGPGDDFVHREDEDEFFEALAIHRCSNGAGPQMRALVDGFFELLRKRDIFLGYTSSEIEKLIGGISVFDMYVIIFHILKTTHSSTMILARRDRETPPKKPTAS